MLKRRIAVLVSGGGTNLQAILDAVAGGDIPNAEVALIISSSADAYALERGRKAGVPGIVIDRASYPDTAERTGAIIAALRAAGTELVVLAGYMNVLSPALVKAFEKRIINIHPSLIPRHCGKGYYGHHVHEAVLAAGDSESGATVHFVDEGVDTGEIILQERVPVLPGDTAERLAARVLEVEHKILVRAAAQVLDALPCVESGGC